MILTLTSTAIIVSAAMLGSVVGLLVGSVVLADGWVGVIVGDVVSEATTFVGDLLQPIKAIARARVRRIVICFFI